MIQERRPAAKAPALDANDVHVWRLATDASSSARETAAAARTLLRQRLADYGGGESAPEIARGEHGKPYAPALPELDFNLSHARHQVLVAFARRQPLGVDIERIDRALDVSALARRYFHPAEADALDALAEPARTVAFLRTWTCKEAILKAIGAGLHFGLHRIVIDAGTGRAAARLVDIDAGIGPPDAWQLHGLEPAPGFVGAVAWRGRPRRLHVLDAADA